VSENSISNKRHDFWAGLTALLAAVLLVAVFFATLYRLRLSLNFNDESFYLAMPYRFLLGDRMFVDELIFFQLSSVIVYPLIALRVHLQGVDGLVLFVRYAYLVFGLLVGCSAFLLFRRSLAWPLALASMLIVPAFVPWGLPSLSYNTMGAGFLVVGLAAGCGGVHYEKKWLLMVAGAAQAASAVAYPTLVVVAAVYGLILLRLTYSRGLLWAAAFLSGLTVIWLPVLLGLWKIGFSHLIEAYSFSAVLGAYFGGSSKVIAIFKDTARSILMYPLLPLAVISLVGAHSLNSPNARRVQAILTVLLPVTLIAWRRLHVPVQSLGIVALWGLLAVVIYATGEEDENDRAVFMHIVIPSLIAGFVYAWSSSNGFLNAGFGLLPAALGASYLYAKSTIRLLRDFGFSRRPSEFATIIPLGLLVSMVVYVQFQFFYFDGSRSELTHTIDSGPFRGIRTSEAHASLIEDLQRDLRRFTVAQDRILFFDSFPAGYLFTSLRPAAKSVWGSPPILTPQADVSHVLSCPPTVAVQVRLWGMQYPPSHPIMKYLAANGFSPLIVTTDYTLYRKSPESIPTPSP